MLHLRRGRIVLRRLSTEHGPWRYYNSRHKEPKNLSWQWSVKKGPELMNCKNINVSKICPKPSFFPRFKKVFIPADQKACEKKKPPMTWKEYWSFLLPDSAPKPPLVTCRKLQAERRKCCGSRSSCSDECTRVNCCPPPKEWYGQAEIFVVPSSLPPIGQAQQEPQPCAPPPPSEPSCVLALKGMCPLPKKSLNMEDYAYKKAFSGINLCDEIKETPSSFKVKGVCVPQLPLSNKTPLSCGYFSEFKEVECPKAMMAKSTVPDLPSLICKEQSEKSSELEKEINVEVKKNVCGRTTFLRPYKYGDEVPQKKNVHTVAYRKQENSTQRQSFHSTSQAQMKNIEANQGSEQHSEANKTESKLLDMEPYKSLSDSTCQPSKSAVGLHNMLLKPLSGRLRDGLHTPPEAGHSEDLYYNPGSQEIDPELTKLAETTRKNMTYGLTSTSNEKENTTTTLAKELSKQAEKKFMKRSKEKGIERRPMSPNKTPYPPSKLSLLKKKKNSTVASQATFMTEAKKHAKKKDKKNKKEKNIICAGCSGVKAAEEELRNPTPKSFIDCKVRPAGRCRGPQRKVHPDEGEPQNPYYKNKQKPYSMCNKQRPIIKKKERPYKMPCEEPKREFHTISFQFTPQTDDISKSGIHKFHSTTCLNDTSTDIPTIYDLLKVRGLGKSGKQAPNHSNDWDSHTSDSYGERICEEYDSLPDLSKYHPKSDDNGIKKMSFPVNLWEYPETKKKSSYNSWSNNEGNKILMGTNRNEFINNNTTFKKRKPVVNMTKDSNNSTPSKYNVLFNPVSMQNQTENIDKSTDYYTNKTHSHDTKFKGMTEFKEQSTSNLKTAEFNFNTESKKVTPNISTAKELSPCPITTQNMWGESHCSSTEQSLSSVALVPQEIKGWEKQKSHNLLNDSSTHDMFRQTEDLKKVSTKPDNDNQSMFYQEKIVLSGSGNLENINESKQD